MAVAEKYNVVYNNAPLVIYRGEGYDESLRGLLGGPRFTASAPEAVNYANKIDEGHRVLVVDGIDYYEHLRGTTDDGKCLWFYFPDLEDDFCEAIIDVDDPKSKLEILAVTDRILNRHRDHQNYSKALQLRGNTIDAFFGTL